MKKAIFLYDYTGYMAKPWIEAGYECWCFDGQHPEGVSKNGLHVTVGMWFKPACLDVQAEKIKNLVGGNVAFIFGFPDCTHMAVSGAKHFAKKLKADPFVQINAAELAKLVKHVGIACKCKWGLENPVSVLATLWRKSDFIFDPYEYGGYLPEDDIHPDYPEYIRPRDAYKKKTCIWHGGGFVEPVKKPVDVSNGYSDQYKKLGGKSLKTKNIRSATPRGFAKAVYLANS